MSDDAFLNVEQSLLGQKWVARLDARGQNTALNIAQTTDIPEIIARIMAARNVAAEEASNFLSPSIRDLMPDPSTMTDCDTGAERLVQAIGLGERVAIFGDYDVDGACSSALLSKFLTHFNVPNEIYIPDRIFEGYGPNPNAIEELINKGAQLIVTVDCGSTSFEALEKAKELNCDVVIIDHHQVNDELPPSVALVNPNRQDDLSGLGHLCAAGVVFMVLVATQRLLRQRKHDKAASFDLLAQLDIVALATVCDVVPLKTLNRAYVVKGLIAARKMHNPGIAALMRIVGIDGPLTPYHLGFLIGPRINAGGRIGDAALGSRLLTLDDPEEADEIAQHLDSLNKERQAMEAKMLEQAEAEVMAEMASGEGPSIIISANDGWHPGIVGLVAARLKEREHRPAFAIAFDANGKGSGSGRSIPGFDVGKMVRQAVDDGLLEKGGGHAMAAGLTVQKEKLGELRTYFEEYAAKNSGDVEEVRSLKIDGALAASGMTPDLVDLIERAGPYGSGHSQPIFVLPAHQLSEVRIVGANHVKLTFRGVDGGKIDGIAFRAADNDMGKFLLNNRGQNFHVAGSISVDYWRGVKRVQIRVLDAALAS
ncbi:single-stranded-DNA-specific exonuclease RecJ [Lentilitoribacter sp. EG35]|uniref:single-stranded-DNA-specific exonuclease RecJ n=1 Tax=Lentilitoribacter sp. EG35 TaxID=3234192 RepID=UPI00345F2052